MKLGEALAQRAELQNRLGQVRDRLRVSALVQEGDQPPEDPEPLLAELEQVAHDLERLIAAINQTNAITRLPSGATLTQALARRDVLGLRHSALKAVADATAQQQARYSRSEIRLVRTFDVAEVRKLVDSLAQEQRELDVEIQAANWTVELTDDQA
ncbi:MAG TPA: DIP1984 family protein [Solirubrobacteraceae bacterium]|nr:DIP1984 family protein [Solirubrobacteraceae bacterium]